MLYFMLWEFPVAAGGHDLPDGGRKSKSLTQDFAESRV